MSRLAPVLDALAGAAPRCGASTVVAVDGRSGAGKSTLARELVAETGAALLELEVIYPGWEGLRAGVERLVADVLVPIAAGRTAHVPRWDWERAEWGTPAEFAPAELIVVEGVGSGSRAVAPYLSVLVWLELAAARRKQRALTRDGDVYRGHWDTWARQEDALLAEDPIASRADVVLS